MKEFITLLFTGIVFVSIGQNATIRGNRELSAAERERSRSAIQQLHNGSLWVRLTTRSAEIAYYRKHGNDRKADDTAREAETLNRAIIAAYSKQFTFCPVYFFADTFSRSIVEGRTADIVFYNTDLKQDAGIRPPEEPFFISEYGTTRSDHEPAFRDDYTYGPGENGVERSTRLYGKGNANIAAFVIMDASFNQLTAPFPYYQKFSYQKRNAKKIEGKILILNEKLTKYHAGS